MSAAKIGPVNTISNNTSAMTLGDLARARVACSRFGSAKKPRMYVKPGESYAAAHARWRQRWQDYRDATIMSECLYQSDVCDRYPRRHFFKAFYGVEAGNIIL